MNIIKCQVRTVMFVRYHDQEIYFEGPLIIWCRFIYIWLAWMGSGKGAKVGEHLYYGETKYLKIDHIRQYKS